MDHIHNGVGLFNYIQVFLWTKPSLNLKKQIGKTWTFKQPLNKIDWILNRISPKNKVNWIVTRAET